MQRIRFYALASAMTVIGMSGGCAKDKTIASPRSALSSTASPYVAVKRLLAEKPPQAVSPTNLGPSTRLPIPTPEDYAADGLRYYLDFDATNQIAWISASGGIGGQINFRSGPWTLDNADISTILNTVSTDQTSEK